MIPHVPTLLVAVVLGYVLLVLELSAARRARQQRPELLLWLRGCWSIVLGGVAIGARVWIPEWLSVLAGNLLLCQGLALFAAAIHQFVLRRPPPQLWRQAGWLSLPLLVWILPWSVVERSQVTSWLYAAYLLPSVVLVLSRGWHAEHSLRTVGVALGLAMLALAWRGLHSLLHPEFYGDLAAPTMGHGMTALAGFLALMGAGWAFVMASFERTLQELEDLATHDGLTRCINRHTADTLLVHALLRGQREGSPVAFVLLDLDHFKQINDVHGHRTGDDVLRRFADAVRARLRASDVFCRVGGEEFGLILPATDGPGALRLAQSVLASVSEVRVPGAAGTPVRVTASAGVAVAASDSSLAAERLYGLADAALYRAKANGRNRAEIAATPGRE